MDITQLFGDETISCNGEFLSDFVETFSDACHVRDARTRKHLLVNRYEAECNGLKSADELTGITPRELWVEDVLCRRDRLGLNSDVISNEKNNCREVGELEEQLLLNKGPISFNRAYIYYDGVIGFESVIKFPISGLAGKKVIAFLTIFQNLTPQLSLYELFQLYQKLFSRRAAVHQLLKYLELDVYFSLPNLPTHTEMHVLFALRDDSRCKAIAKKLGCAVKTASNHINNLQEKLRPFTLYDVLFKLRAVPVGHKQEV